VQFGLPKGFSDLLVTSIYSDKRSISDFWISSVLLKIASLGITDKNLIQSFEKMIDSNIEKLANTTLVKLVILCVAL
jgi:hypothetical protein